MGCRSQFPRGKRAGDDRIAHFCGPIEERTTHDPGDTTLIKGRRRPPPLDPREYAKYFSLPAIVYIEGAVGPDQDSGPMLYVSPQVREILGFEPEEWMGDPYSWAHQFHPEDRGRIASEYLRIADTGEPFSDA